MAEPKGELSSEPKSTDDLKVEGRNSWTYNFYNK